MTGQDVLIAYIGGVICGRAGRRRGVILPVLIAYIGGVICGVDQGLEALEASLNRLHWRGYLRGKH